MSRQTVGAFSIAAAFTGTLIGAGFASGQELMQFFVIFGPPGLWGLVLAAVLIMALGSMAMLLARWRGWDALPAENPVLQKITDGAMALFFAGIYVVMLAGADSLVREQAGAAPLTGGVIMAVLAAATVAGGMDSVIGSFNVVVPFMVAVAAAAGISVLIHTPDPAMAAAVAGENRWTGTWATASLLFVSYNMLAAYAVLAPMGAAARDDGQIVSGAAMGGACLGVLGMILWAAMGSRFEMAALSPLPMMALAQDIHPLMGVLYALALFAGIYTTAVGCLMGFTDRFGMVTGLRGRWVLLGVSVLALGGSRVGFSRLIARVYPISGYLGGLAMAVVAVRFIRQASARRRRGG